MAIRYFVDEKNKGWKELLFYDESLDVHEIKNKVFENETTYEKGVKYTDKFVGIEEVERDIDNCSEMVLYKFKDGDYAVSYSCKLEGEMFIYFITNEDMIKEIDESEEPLDAAISYIRSMEGKTIDKYIET